MTGSEGQDTGPARLLRGLAVVISVGWLGAMLLLSPHHRLLERWIDPGMLAEPWQPPPFGGDAFSEWVGGWLLWHDRANLYDADVIAAVQHDPSIVGVVWPAGDFLPLFYAPAWYLVASPLHLLPAPVAGDLFLVAMWGAAMATWWWAHRGAGALRQGVGLWLLVLWPPVQLALNSGQKGTLWLLALLAVGHLLHRERPLVGGLLLGLLAVKPPLMLGLGAFFLLKRRWRVVAGTAAGAALVAVVSLALGVGVVGDWLAMVAAASDYHLRPTYQTADDYTWHGQLVLALQPLGLGGVARWLWLLPGALSLGAAAWAFRGPLRPGDDDFSMRWGLLLFLVPLTAPKFQWYDVPVLLLALWPLVRAAIPRGGHEPDTPLVVALVGLYLALGWSPHVAEATGLQPGVFAALAALLGAPWLLRRARRCGGDSERQAER